MERLCKALSQETFIWLLIGVSKIRKAEGLIVACVKIHLPLLVCHGVYQTDMCGPLYCSRFDAAAGAHELRSRFTWATLFLSRKPECNSSHMSFSIEESDETLVSLSVFLLCLFVFPYPDFYLFHCLTVVFKDPQNSDYYWNTALRIINQNLKKK